MTSTETAATAPGFGPYVPRLGLDNLPLPVGPPATLEDAVRLFEFKLAAPHSARMPILGSTLDLFLSAAPEVDCGDPSEGDIYHLAPDQVRELVRAGRSLLTGAPEQGAGLG